VTAASPATAIPGFLIQSSAQVSDEVWVNGAYTRDDLDITAQVHEGVNSVAFKVYPNDPNKDLSMGWIEGGRPQRLGRRGVGRRRPHGQPVAGRVDHVDGVVPDRGPEGDAGAQHVVLPADVRLPHDEAARLPSLGRPSAVPRPGRPGDPELDPVRQAVEHLRAPQRLGQELHRLEDQMARTPRSPFTAGQRNRVVLDPERGQHGAWRAHVNDSVRSVRAG
jgi:hypothetical protein